MSTITIKFVDDEPEELNINNQTVPIIIGLDTHGALTAADLAQRQLTNPADCDHAGSRWSDNLALRCPRCGAPLFLPPRLLAQLNASTLTAMHALWVAAGWPLWRGETWAAWPEHWTIEPHPLFAHTGGIAVRNDRLDQFRAVAQEFHEDSRP